MKTFYTVSGSIRKRATEKIQNVNQISHESIKKCEFEKV